MYDRLERAAVDRLLPPVPHGGKLLEVGCGTGHWSEYFTGKGFAVTGVDISERMIAVARQRNVTGGTFDVADAEQLPFPDGSFDVVAAITVLEFTADPARVISEMTRCVKKAGGMLVLGVLNRLSGYNQRRQRRAASMYASATLFSPADLRTLLAPIGEATILAAGFVPRWDSLVWLSPLLERWGRLTENKHGAFLAAKAVL
jgi:ubiquinone/menaquinone biosynthesis C-methylase UbiE